MRLSSDDLPMFFAPHHAALADRLRAAAPALEGVELPGAHATETERDRAAARALADAGLFELVVPLEHASSAPGTASASAAAFLAGPASGASSSASSGSAAGSAPGSGPGPGAAFAAGAVPGSGSASGSPSASGSASGSVSGSGSGSVLGSGAGAAMLSSAVSHSAVGGGPVLDTRALCLAREMLGYVSARADSIFAVQGLGTHSLALAGNQAQRAHLKAFARGAGIAAFALTEPEAGSDVAAIATRAAPTADGYRLDGDKLFISNLGIADHATVVATTEPALGGAGLTAFWVPLDAPGVTVKPMTAIAAHPIGALELRGVELPASAKIGEVGQGMKLALTTLDAFRVSVGAAAVGMARRAFDEALRFVTRRSQFGKPLAEQPLVQAHLADMLVDLDAARLLVLRAA